MVLVVAVKVAASVAAEEVLCMLHCFKLKFFPRVRFGWFPTRWVGFDKIVLPNPINVYWHRCCRRSSMTTLLITTTTLNEDNDDDDDDHDHDDDDYNGDGHNHQQQQRQHSYRTGDKYLHSSVHWTSANQFDLSVFNRRCHQNTHLCLCTLQTGLL